MYFGMFIEFQEQKRKFDKENKENEKLRFNVNTK